MAEIDRAIRAEAAKRLANIPTIDSTLTWMEQGVNEFGFAQRISTLNQVLIDMTRSKFDPNNFRHLAQYRRLTRNDYPPTIQELYNRIKTADRSALRLMAQTFSRVRQEIVSGNWPFVLTLADEPNKLSSGILIEGIGVLTAEYFRKPELARESVLAIEEVLIEKYPRSALLHDVIGWMESESFKFSPYIQGKIADDPL